MISINDPDLTPAQSEAVRRLLADARHDEPMPPEVITRLDGVLADLHGPEASGAPEVDPDPGSDLAPVTPIRRRSRAPAILLAAAAVVAIGFGVTQVLPTGETPDSAGSGQDSAPLTAPESSQGDSSQGDSGAEQPAPSTDDSDREGQYSKNSLRDQRKVERLLDRIPLRDVTATTPSADGQKSGSHRSLAGCGPIDLQLGGLRADLRTRAFYRGKPVVVVFPPPKEGVREAVLFSCPAGPSDDPLTTVTLSAP